MILSFLSHDLSTQFVKAGLSFDHITIAEVPSIDFPETRGAQAAIVKTGHDNMKKTWEKRDLGSGSDKNTLLTQNINICIVPVRFATTFNPR